MRSGPQIRSSAPPQKLPAHRPAYRLPSGGKRSDVHSGIGYAAFSCDAGLDSGYGNQTGHSERYRGQEYSVDLRPKMQITPITADEDVEEVLSAIVESACSGNIGDGKVWTQDIDVVRVRTGERSPAAI